MQIHFHVIKQMLHQNQSQPSRVSKLNLIWEKTRKYKIAISILT